MTGFLFGDDADEFFSKDKNASTNKSIAKDDSQNAPGMSDESPLSVSQLTAWIKRTIDQNIASFWIAGEVSNVTKATSGHV
ncbi:MAG: exodeoxyribonuclease VII large subunit, partial [Pirellula sp.]